ncbi:hydroxymethylpyrimidine/phosphomethylpyrimidine kinase [Arachidicoccus sp.]|jgi:hydroxymethylpyrimidine/phosphomethylpyrimidine kinase|uniref:hydroxymethylpyrimidine/phosphomethylpyrimidine kinase n=1 Tax=Arachidicoccus sp. TaxID=1872624 RepID=UPI003D1E093E
MGGVIKMKENNFILTIAGHDPSNGAGITSDIKTFAMHRLYGLSVCTAITIQNDINFKQCIWTDVAVILAQIEILFERFEISVVKIGIIESWETLSVVLDKLHQINRDIKIVLDPIFKASANFDFHLNENQFLLNKIWRQCYVITPNYEEIQSIHPSMDIENTIQHISSFTNIYLKGGHRADKKGWDELHLVANPMLMFPPFTEKTFEKHGSGCVLSSALASNIALGEKLETAGRKAKYYTEQYLNSNDSLLGNHQYNAPNESQNVYS